MKRTIAHLYFEGKETRESIRKATGVDLKNIRITRKRRGRVTLAIITLWFETMKEASDESDRIEWSMIDKHNCTGIDFEPEWSYEECSAAGLYF